ncbi:defender against death DAD protein [Xylaria cf. heliscus]|nr:defender against death DAD protein [Xylaria cf. heliscus]
MAPKKTATATGPATASATSTSTSTSSNTSSSSSQIDKVALNIVQHYHKTTPQRTKLIDAFMSFLVIVGGLQFAYCVLAGNYPFNAFLSGFCATVGQFVLTASLRIQTTEANKSEFPSVSPERAFADFVVGSLILHFFCINFIN